MSRSSLKSYSVQMGDCSLQLKSNHDSSTVNEILQVVEKQIRLAKKNNRALSIHKTFALCCLNVAEELVCLKKSLKRQLNVLESSTRCVLSELKSSSTIASK